MPSSPALATCLPSGERLAPSAQPSCALIVVSARPRARFQTRTTPSRPGRHDAVVRRRSARPSSPSRDAPARPTASVTRASPAAARSGPARCPAGRGPRSARARLKPGSTSRKLVALAASSREAAISRWRSASRALVEGDDRHRGDRRERDEQARRTANQMRRRRAARSARDARGWRRGTRARARSATARGSSRHSTRLGQAAAAEQRAVVAVQPAPLVRGGGDAAMDAQALAVLLDPAAQPRPLAQQRLVRDLDACPALTVSRRWSVNSSTTRATSSLRSVSSSASGDAPALDRAAGALGGEPHEDAARRSACCGGVEPAERVLGEPRDRAAHAAACARTPRGAGAARRAAATARAAPSTAAAARRARPRRRPRARRRARARPAGRRAAPGARRPGAARRAASSVTSTWLAASRPRQLRVRGAALVVVGADREHDDAAAARVAGGVHERSRRTPALAARRRRR